MKQSCSGLNIREAPALVSNREKRNVIQEAKMSWLRLNYSKESRLDGSLNKGWGYRRGMLSISGLNNEGGGLQCTHFIILEAIILFNTSSYM